MNLAEGAVKCTLTAPFGFFDSFTLKKLLGFAVSSIGFAGLNTKRLFGGAGALGGFLALFGGAGVLGGFLTLFGGAGALDGFLTLFGGTGALGGVLILFGGAGALGGFLTLLALAITRVFKVTNFLGSDAAPIKIGGSAINNNRSIKLSETKK